MENEFQLDVISLRVNYAELEEEFEAWLALTLNYKNVRFLSEDKQNDSNY